MGTDCGMREDGEQEYARFGGIKNFDGYGNFCNIFFLEIWCIMLLKFDREKWILIQSQAYD